MLTRAWRLFAVAAIGVLVGAGLAAQPAGATEYVTNGNFSAGLTAWNMPTGGGAAGTETCCANPPGGVPNAFFHPNGQGSGTSLNGYLVSWQNISGAASGTYTLSARVRTSGGVQAPHEHRREQPAAVLRRALLPGEERPLGGDLGGCGRDLALPRHVLGNHLLRPVHQRRRPGRPVDRPLRVAGLHPDPQPRDQGLQQEQLQRRAGLGHRLVADRLHAVLRRRR